MRTSAEITREIEQTFDFVPPFFGPAVDNPQVLENLWQQTRIAYLSNPLPTRFKEQLSAYLSRYCAVPYCLVCHSCTLRPLGMSAQQILALLNAPAPLAEDVERQLEALAERPPALATPADWDLSTERSLLECAIYLFLEDDDTEWVRSALLRSLGSEYYQHLVALFAYLRTCMLWMEAHPEVLYEVDRRVQENLGPLLCEEAGLGDFLRDYRIRVSEERRGRKEQRAVLAERRRNEAALRASEERLRLSLEAARMGFWEWDLHAGRMIYSQRTEADLGFASGSDGSFEAFLAKVHPEDRPGVVEALEQAVTTDRAFEIEFRVLWPDGSVHWAASQGQVYRGKDGLPLRVTGLYTDITERREAQEQLEHQSRRAQLLASLTLRIRQSLSIDRILDTTVSEVRNALEADRALVYRLLADGAGAIVSEAVGPGVQPLPGKLAVDPCFAHGYVERYPQGRVRAIEDVGAADIAPCHREFLGRFGVQANLVVPLVVQEKLWGLLIVHQCSRSRRWLVHETGLLVELSNQVSVALAQAQLIEQQNYQREELTRTNAELQQFATIASHDLQEPLRKIQTFGDRLRTKYGDTLDTQGSDYLTRMQSAAGRMQVLIDDLLVLSQVATKAQTFTGVDLASVTQEVVADLEVRIEQLGARVEIGELPLIEAEPLQMRQLLQNLLSNALKFHKPGESPRVRVCARILTAAGVPSGPRPSIHEWCQLVVEDNGIGFEERYVERIFNVFQRLHGRGEYEGTGIGLAICRRIAERHGGQITAHSTPGAGAAFVVTLPVARAGEG